MKKFMLKFLPAIAFIATLAVGMSSCKDKDDDPIELFPKLEGVYIYGTNTIAASANEASARMSLAVLVPDQGASVPNMDGVYGKIMYIGANSTLSVVEIKSEVPTKYGITGGGSKTLGTEIGTVPVNDVVTHGTLTANADPITITTEGLYYVYVDINTKNFVAMQIKPDMIGDATPLDWGGGTKLPMVSTNKDSTVFEATIALKGAAGYRYRFNDGWNIFSDGNIVTMGSLGVPDYGVAWETGINDLGFHLSNIPNKEGGNVKVRLVYDAKTTEWHEVKTVSFEGVQLSLFGNAYKLSNGNEAAWDLPYELKTPTVAGSVYSWVWDDVELIEGRQFVINQDGGWAGVIIAFPGATNTGDAFTSGKIVNATTLGEPDANYYVVTGGKYKIEVKINGVGSVKSVNITAK